MNFKETGFRPFYHHVCALELNDKLSRKLKNCPEIEKASHAVVYGYIDPDKGMMLEVLGAGKQAPKYFYIGISVAGLCFGAFMGVFPGFTADQFGQMNNSVNYGIMFIGFALAGYVGPTVMNTDYRSTGDYHPAFLIAMGLAGVGIVLSLIYCKLARR